MTAEPHGQPTHAEDGEGQRVTSARNPEQSVYVHNTATRPRTRRLTADLPTEDADTLAKVAAETGFNKVTTLIRAIRVLAELVRAERSGGEVTIRYADGRRERLLLR